MFNNPYFNQQTNIERINNQIKELENLKGQYQSIPQQPIQNIINTNANQSIDFEARFVNENEEVENIPINRKTAFISPKNGYLKIKEINGDITKYDLIPPKDEKDLRIEELEKKIKEMEEQKNEHTNINGTVDEVKRSSSNDKQSSKKQS